LPNPYEQVVPANEVAKVELSHVDRWGRELQVRTAIRQLRDKATGQIESGTHITAVWIERKRSSRAEPDVVWRVDFGQWSTNLWSTEPYGFLFHEGDAGGLVLTFFKDKKLYFTPIEVNRPERLGPSTYRERISLTSQVLEKFGDANWKPRFEIQSVERIGEDWIVQIGVKDKQFRLRRTAPDTWVDDDNDVLPRDAP
jgi:hypothetical protein